MFDKRIKQLGSYAIVKKICIFFATFAVTLTVMGGTFGFKSGGGVPAAGVVYAAVQDSGVKKAEVRQTSTEAFKAEKYKIGENVLKAIEVEIGTKDGTEAAGTKRKSTNTPQKDKGARAKEFVYSENIPMSYELQEYTYRKCAERGLEYELVLAIMWRESRFNADAVNVNANGTVDSGIMQINDVNKKWLQDHYGIEDLMDPYQNIDAGTAMLGTLTQKHGEHKAMMAYQYGEIGMRRKLSQGRTTSVAIEAAYRQRDYYKKLIASV